MDSNLIFHDDNILARFFGRSSNFTDIPNPLFKEYNVKKGLRNDDGTGDFSRSRKDSLFWHKKCIESNGEDID